MDIRIVITHTHIKQVEVGVAELLRLDHIKCFCNRICNLRIVCNNAFIPCGPAKRDCRKFCCNAGRWQAVQEIKANDPN